VDGKDIYLAGGYVGKPLVDFRYPRRLEYNVDMKTWTAMLFAGTSGVSFGLNLFGGADINRADKGDHWVLSLAVAGGAAPLSRGCSVRAAAARMC